jgi:hypothetical protein
LKGNRFTALTGRTRHFGWQWGGLVVLGASLLAVLLSVGCSLDENPLKIDRIDVQVTRGSFLVDVPGSIATERRFLVDGLATDPEWGTAPYYYVSMSPEQGTGGGTFTTALKVVTDSVRIYFLVQWPDLSDNDLGPRLIFDSDQPISGNCDPQLETCVWRLTDEDEDRIAFMFDMGDARDSRGTFAELGCQVACHGNMHPIWGEVDIWHWRAARTNPLQFPLIAGVRVGFADDEHADGDGRAPDTGTPFFSDNFEMIDCGDGTSGPRPLKVADALDADGQPSTRDNDFLQPCSFISQRAGLGYNLCSTRNPCRLFEQEEVEVWVEGDDMSAFLLERPGQVLGSSVNIPRESRHDVEARGRWEFGVWTLEMSRPLATGRDDDVRFDIEPGSTTTFSMAIMNNAGDTHSGSPVIHLRF